MKTRNVLASMGILLLTGASAWAQIATTPPAPVAPAQPGRAARTMELPMVWSGAEGNSVLGIIPEEITKENMSRYNLRSLSGVAIKEVTKDSPAEKAGLRAGDVIVRFDGETVTNFRKLQRLIGETVPEQNVRVTVSRNGSEQEVSVTMAERRNALSFAGNPGFAFGNNLPELSGRQLRVVPFPPGGMGGDFDGFAFSSGNNRRIGVTTQELSEQLARHFGVEDGLLIATVAKDSPADKAGLRAGDIVTEIDGRKIQTVADLTRGIVAKTEGEVTLTIVRDKSKRTIKVTPEKRNNVIVPGATPRTEVTPGAQVTPRVLPAPYTRSVVTPRINTSNLFRRIL